MRCLAPPSFHDGSGSAGCARVNAGESKHADTALVSSFISGCRRLLERDSSLRPWAFLHLLHYFVQVEARRLLPLRELLERIQELANVGLRGPHDVRALYEPVVVGV